MKRPWTDWGMLVLFALLLALTAASVSCTSSQFRRGLDDFGRGAAREGTRQAAGIGSEVLVRELGDKIEGLGERVDKVGAQVESIPPPPPPPDPKEPEDNTLWYTAGALAAYIGGSLLKGGYRKWRGSGKGE